jgi:hypothetical protein
MLTSYWGKFESDDRNDKSYQPIHKNPKKLMKISSLKLINLFFLTGIVVVITFFESLSEALPILKNRRQSLALLLASWIVLYEIRVILLVIIASRTNNPEKYILPRSHNSNQKMAKLDFLVNAEKRFWLYALIWKLPSFESFEGKRHFGIGSQNGNADAWFGWAIVNFMPTPVIHVMLHYKNPIAAALTTFACFMSSLWLWAEHRAAKSRPISLGNEKLYLRYGLFIDREINIREIVDIRACSYRDKFDGVTRHVGLGAPNVIFRLQNGESIAIGVDDPTSFIKALTESLVDEPDFISASQNLASVIRLA